MAGEADALLDLLITQGFEPAEDVSFVSVSEDQLARIPGDAVFCSFRDWHYKVWRGVNFRKTRYVKEQALHRGRVAWNITKRTKDLFKLKGQPE